MHSLFFGLALVLGDLPIDPSASTQAVAAAVRVTGSSAVASSADLITRAETMAAWTTTDEGWLEFKVPVAQPGRYRCELAVAPATPDAGGEIQLWVEDYVGNPDGRTYDITGPLQLAATGSETTKVGSFGAPLDAGEHLLRVHYSGGALKLESLGFELVRPMAPTPTTMVQRTEGDKWALVWSDEFNASGLPDPAKWTADVGDWGWGNREPQYYTEGRLENARQEKGMLVIEARKGDLGHAWTSARLTTRGKCSFLYGRVEIRAQVPSGDGAWAAGWMLGDAYRDEVSWPYCGEIDILEGVGREIDDASGDGLNHASCHTRAFYFKQGNHISNTTQVKGMGTGFHTYSMEWTPEHVKIFLDGEHYYTYDKRADELEWPFDKPQNLILNLAMGGGMGGPIDPALTSQTLLVDYVRVFGRQ